MKKIPPNQICKRVNLVIQECGLVNYEKHKIIKLSLGYRKRVGIAQSLIANPPVLMLDEPTAGLDPLQIKETRNLLLKLKKTKTILLSTHILTEVEQICDEVIILYKGKVVLSKKIDELLTTENLIVEVKAPLNKFYCQVASLMGVNSINLINKNIFSINIKMDYLVDIQIIELCRKNSWKLMRMEYKKNNLEDVYIKVTQSERIV